MTAQEKAEEAWWGLRTRNTFTVLRPSLAEECHLQFQVLKAGKAHQTEMDETWVKEELGWLLQVDEPEPPPTAA